MSAVESPVMMSPTAVSSPVTSKPSFFSSFRTHLEVLFTKVPFSKPAALDISNMKGYTFRVVGVRNYRVKEKQETFLHVADTELRTLCTVKSDLNASSTVQELESYLRRFFDLPKDRALLILFGDEILTNSPQSSLSDFGVTDLSLLAVAVSAMPESPRQQRTRRSEQQKQNKTKVASKFSLESTKGLDVITQEEAFLYRMPGCGHCMSKQSLFEYCESVMSGNNRDVRLKCPHTVERKCEEEEQKGAPPRPSQPQDGICGQMWDYADVKKVLEANDGDALKRQTKISEEQKKKLLDFYDLRHTYESLVHDKMNVRAEFLQKMNDAQDKIRHAKYDGGMSIQDICAKAKQDAKQQIWDAPDFEYQRVDHADSLLAKLELNIARNMIKHNCDVQTCTQCDTLHFRPKPQNEEESKNQENESVLQKKEDAVLCGRCTKQTHFCWKCGKLGKENHFCDAAFRDELVKVLAQAELKKIGQVEGVPSIRACPTCAQLIYHIDACKHMECKGCTRFCFVCLKPKVNGNWQCGCSSDVCPIAPPQTHETLPASDKLKQSKFQLW